MRIKLGKFNQLQVTKRVDFGIYLDGGDEGDILLPKRYEPEGVEIGDTLNVFVYLDQEERPVATTEKPLAQVGDFAYLTCTWVNEYGAFLSWGLMKDLFCPFREQKARMIKGNSYIVHIHIDKESYRIVASAKIDRYLTPYGEEELSDDSRIYAPGDEVDLLIWQKTDLGFKVIIDNRYAGLVYQDQIFKIVHTGDRMRGYIQAIRPDGKIDVSLQPHGRQRARDFSQQLLAYLNEHNGYCDLGDKSDAEEIKKRFHVSKKTYKQAIGDLYKKRLIIIQEEGIRLTT